MIAYLFNVLFPKCIREWFFETFTAMDYFPLLTYAGKLVGQDIMAFYTTTAKSWRRQ